MTFDLHKLLSKLPFKTGLYDGELHYIISPGNVASYCGPGTNLDKRLDSNDNSLPHSLPKNQVDEACRIHDIDYRDSQSLSDKHAADRKLIDALDKINPSGFSEFIMKKIVRFIIASKLRLGLGMSLEEARQTAKEIHKPYKQGERRVVYIPSRNDTHCADIMEVDGKYLLTYMDGFSKLAIVFYIKNKNAKSIISAFQQAFEFMQGQPKKVWVDRGREFYNKDVDKFLKDKGITLYSTNSELKCMLIERFNRTLRQALEVKRTELELQGKKFEWIKVLSEVMDEYNSGFHRTIKMSPIEAHTDEHEIDVINRYIEKYKKKSTGVQKYKVGDLVRIYRYRSIFEKKSAKAYTQEIFRIKEVHNTRPYTYSIEDLKSEPIIGKFYAFELSRVTV